MICRSGVIHRQLAGAFSGVKGIPDMEKTAFPDKIIAPLADMLVGMVGFQLYGQPLILNVYPYFWKIGTQSAIQG